MNPIFKPYDGWKGFPRRSFGRLDAVEPDNVSQADDAFFAFDVVDADWREFSSGSELDLDEPKRIEKKSKSLWDELFGFEDRPQTTFFDGMPIYRIEITARRGDNFRDFLEKVPEGQWVEFVLNKTGHYPVDVYGAIVSDAVPAHLVGVSSLQGTIAASLSALFNSTKWKKASLQDIRAVLGAVVAPIMLCMYDVGQGGASALMDCGNNARLFFDLGAGSYGNSKTRPSALRFCWRVDPPVILSHWDTDHWAGEHTDPGATARTWIAPLQTGLGPTHHAFAARISSVGRLLIWAASAGAVLRVTLTPGINLRLGRCTGKTRNGTGIACIVESRMHKASWLLTGDAGYSEIPIASKYDFVGVVVPHHGADMTHLGTPPAAPASSYRRLFYSFGPDNKYGSVRHPTSAAVAEHTKQGWLHGAWNPTAPIATVPAGADVLATACNSGATPSSHLKSTVMGWSAAPAVPLAGLPCWTYMPGACTTDVRQS